MNAVVLAAGMSSRLRALCPDRPKCLLEVGGVPILRRAIEHLGACGVEDLTIVAGFCEDRLRAALEEWRPPIATRVVTNEAFARTNNAYSLLQARAHVEHREFLLLDADIVFDREVLVRLAACPASDCLALRPADDLGDEEIKCQIAESDRVIRIGKDVPGAEAAGESIGIERFCAATSTRLFAALADRMARPEFVNEYYEATFQVLIDGGVAIHSVSMAGLSCAEIDTLQDLHAAEAMMRRSSPVTGV